MKKQPIEAEAQAGRLAALEGTYGIFGCISHKAALFNRKN